MQQVLPRTVRKVGKGSTVVEHLIAMAIILYAVSIVIMVLSLWLRYDTEGVVKKFNERCDRIVELHDEGISRLEREIEELRKGNQGGGGGGIKRG